MLGASAIVTTSNGVPPSRLNSLNLLCSVPQPAPCSEEIRRLLPSILPTVHHSAVGFIFFFFPYLFISQLS